MAVVDDPGDGLVTLRPHPADGKRCAPWEREATMMWSERNIYRPGVSHDLDLFEHANWARLYPHNLKFANPEAMPPSSGGRKA